MKSPIYLGVNIDHIATLREARGVHYPDPIEAAKMAEEAGADGITLHLREDRRHIQDYDLTELKQICTTHVNLEMAVTDEMVEIAEEVGPHHCCLVPEKREELTTEGGLDVIKGFEKIAAAVDRLTNAGIEVSLFIDPDIAQIEAARDAGATTIELHTGAYANAESEEEEAIELERIARAAQLADAIGLTVNAGHGLHYENVMPIAIIPQINELNIGHSIIAFAVFVGVESAVREMKNLMLEARALTIES